MRRSVVLEFLTIFGMAIAGGGSSLAHAQSATDTVVYARLRADLPDPWAASASRGAALADAVSRETIDTALPISPSSIRPLFGAAPPSELPAFDLAPRNRGVLAAYRWLRIDARIRDGRSRANLRDALLRSGQFDIVAEANLPVEWAQSSSINDPLYAGVGSADPHKRQWAIDQGRFPAAFAFTEGRTLVGAVEQGTNPTHPDLSLNLRPQYTASVNKYKFPAFIGPEFTGLFPQSSVLNPPVGTTVPVDGNPSLFLDLHNLAGHGVHVSGIIAASKNNAQGGTGGCPGCALSVVRAYGPNVPLAFDTVFDLGATAVNFSAVYDNAFTDALASLAPLYDLINLMTVYDTVVVASMGNRNRTLEIASQTKPAYWYFFPFPALLPNVIGVGGSDVRGWRWEELRIANRPLADRHPLTDYSLYNPEAVAFRCDFGTKRECAPNFGTSNRPTPFTLGLLNLPAGTYGIAITAPAAQVLSTIDRTYTPFRCAATASGTNPCTNSNNPANYPPNGQRIGSEGVQAYTNLGLVPDPSFANVAANSPLTGFDAYGPMTGTSMSAPYVSAAAGLVRSVNPLVAASAVKALLQQTARPLTVPPARGPYTFAEVGSGLIDAEAAVRRTLGTVATLQARNRLIPLFALTSNDVDLAAAGAGARAWLYSTSPQVVMAAIEGRLYQSADPALPSAVTSTDENGPQSLAQLLPPSTENDFGVTRFVDYIRSSSLGIGAELPSSVYSLPAPYKSAARIPSTSAWLFATPFNPFSAQAGALVPLYRLSMKCNQVRKHYYVVSDADRNVATAGPSSCSAAESTSTQGYYYDTVEGYLFAASTPAAQRPGAEALYRKYSSADKAFALVLASEEALAAYATYTSGRTLLGYVYSGVTYGTAGGSYADMDNDGLPDSFELVIGTVEHKADSDGDGLTDLQEYPIAGIQPSGYDPLAP